MKSIDYAQAFKQVPVLIAVYRELMNVELGAEGLKVAAESPFMINTSGELYCGPWMPYQLARPWLEHGLYTLATELEYIAHALPAGQFSTEEIAYLVKLGQTHLKCLSRIRKEKDRINRMRLKREHLLN